jgi:pyruvate, water dikinase
MKWSGAPAVPKVLALALAASSCGDGRGRAEPDWVHVAVRLPGGSAPDAFHVTIARQGGEVSTLVCPEPLVPSSTERCAAEGFELSSPRSGTEVTLRSRGYGFVTSSLAPGRDVTIDLTPVSPADQTPDYATGFGGDGCIDDLLALALPLSTDLGESSSVKFYVADLLLAPRVYFQNTKLHPLHFDFASRILGVPESATEFARKTYSGEDRTAMAGTLTYYPGVSGVEASGGTVVDAPWTLNFFSSDDVTPEQVRVAHRLVEERISCLDWSGRERRLVYLPAGDLQERQAAEDAEGFGRQAILSTRHSDFYAGISLQALNPGVAFGTLKRMTPEELAATPVSYRDLLLLTRLPNQLPVVAGTITEEFQTPLAHVNVAARTRGTPNLAYPGASEDASIAPLIDELVRLEVGAGDFSIRAATLAEAEEFWRARLPARFVPAFDSSFTGVPSWDELVFSDSIRVGAKAANLAELSRALGENAPAEGLAVPFHYYEAHLDRSRSTGELCDAAATDCSMSGRDPDACQYARELCLPPDVEAETLTDHVARLLADESFEQDTVKREAALGQLRYLVENSPLDPDFASLLDSRVAEVFQTARVRLRSSTNSEDLANFSGAGLYESYGARADGGDEAPSRVIPKVFSAVWSFRAFEERSFWNIDHRAVRMGTVINEAFTEELANGVLVTANIADPSIYGMYVNVQKGEQSVTNPTNGALPETFSIIDGPEGLEVVRQRFSTLSPEQPVLGDEEIAALYGAAAKARAHFEPLYDLGPGQLILEMEFKLTPAREIVFKQARPYTVAAD